jgi:ribosomal protein S18 acetylase RimI-like enzyme
MTVTLRAATPADLDAVLPRTCALNAHEGIEVPLAKLRAALATLLANAALGRVWLIERDNMTVGYAIVTFGFDLEFAGRDAFLTEIWVDESERCRGVGKAALALLEPELRALDIAALHLGVRPENPALRLYERSGFQRVPRLWLTRQLS